MAESYKPLPYDFERQHDGYEHLAINNTFCCRLLTRFASHTTGKLFSRQGFCIRISRNKILKTGRHVHLTEGATMQYIAKNTNIPVPKVFCSFVHKKRAYIVMERIQGTPFSWYPSHKSDNSVENLLAQLKAIFSELYALQAPPATGVESCAGGSLHDSRISHGNPRFGPFKSIQDFHFWLRQEGTQATLQSRKVDQDWHDVRQMMDLQDGPWPSPRFAHGDLNPSNVIVRNNKVVGIIDWEFAGWYPHYWEFTSAWFGNIIRPEWQQLLGDILFKPTPEVFAMEETRHKWWGEF